MNTESGNHEPPGYGRPCEHGVAGRKCGICYPGVECSHGHLARKCPHCELAEAEAEIERRDEIIRTTEKLWRDSEAEAARLKAENAEMRDEILNHLREGPHCPFCEEWVSAEPFVAEDDPRVPRPHCPDCIYRKLKGGE